MSGGVIVSALRASVPTWKLISQRAVGCVQGASALPWPGHWSPGTVTSVTLALVTGNMKLNFDPLRLTSPYQERIQWPWLLRLFTIPFRFFALILLVNTMIRERGDPQQAQEIIRKLCLNTKATWIFKIPWILKAIVLVNSRCNAFWLSYEIMMYGF